MRLSIIVPMYNCEKTIENCILSLKNDLLNYEIIVVDDGSTDNSNTVVKRMCSTNPKIKLFYKKNGGVSSARNYGIIRASGEYLLFVDSDDELINFECIDDSFFNGDICIFNYKKKRQRFYNAPLKLIFNKIYERHLFLKDIYFKYDVARNYIWGKFIKKELITNNNIFFDENCNYGEDALFLSDVVDVSSKIVVNKVELYLYNNSFDTNRLSNITTEKLGYFVNISKKIIEKKQCISKKASDYYLDNYFKYLFSKNNNDFDDMILISNSSHNYRRYYNLQKDNPKKFLKICKRKKRVFNIRTGFKNKIKQMMIKNK